MKRSWLVAVSLALVLTMVGLCGCNTGSTGEVKLNLNSQQEGIWVSGTGKVTVIPDIATLGLGITAQAVSVAEAQSQAAEAMDKVMTALVNNGVAKKDIQTQYFSISQVTRWDREKEIVVGYRVTNMVTAKIRKIDKAGSIIDAVAAAGGDFTRINSISFSVDDPSPYYEEARQKAMADAKAKAEQLAGLSGVKLGKPTYISEGTLYPPVIYREAGMAAPAPAPPTPISPGEVELSLSVQVVYAILD
jgi:hypothetical protein